MADFGSALSRTLDHEGVMSDHPADPGGLTVYGVAANRNQGDALADAVFARAAELDNDISLMSADGELVSRVSAFYRRRYWDRMSLGGMDSQELADGVFDFAVVSGISRSVTLLQEAVNALNRNEQTWPDVAEDGGLGPVTLGAVNSALREDARVGSIDLRLALGLARGRFFLDLMSRRPRLEQFARGWFRHRTGLRVA